MNSLKIHTDLLSEAFKHAKFLEKSKEKEAESMRIHPSRSDFRRCCGGPLRRSHCRCIEVSDKEKERVGRGNDDRDDNKSAIGGDHSRAVLLCSVLTAQNKIVFVSDSFLWQ
ncbi:hypothetical protein SLA2020_497810 [Shorea laevis]